MTDWAWKYLGWLVNWTPRLLWPIPRREQAVAARICLTERSVTDCIVAFFFGHRLFIEGWRGDQDSLVSGKVLEFSPSSFKVLEVGKIIWSLRVLEITWHGRGRYSSIDWFQFCQRYIALGVHRAVNVLGSVVYLKCNKLCFCHIWVPGL